MRSLKSITLTHALCLLAAPKPRDFKRAFAFKGTDSKETIEKRLINAYKEMQCLESFDYLIINEDLEKSKEIILSIAKTLVHRLKAFNFEKICKAWKNETL